MNKQQILNHLISVSLFGNFEVGRAFNTAVVKLALENENTFDIDLLLRMVTASGFCPNFEGQQKALNFVVDNILSKQNVNNPMYVPSELSKDWPNWAVDASGCAFYYNTMPKQISKAWDVEYGDMLKGDGKFTPDDFKHMFEGDNWKNTLQTWEGPKDYVPVFTDEHRKWAIDECGDAYFYKKILEHSAYVWHGDCMTYDSRFNKEDYKHMWKNGAWKNSKITK